MAGSPDWKVYDSHGVYQAACKEVEAAAVLMGFYDCPVGRFMVIGLPRV